MEFRRADGEQHVARLQARFRGEPVGQHRLDEDAGRGRLYLPAEDMRRFGYDQERLRRGERDDSFREMMRF